MSLALLPFQGFAGDFRTDALGEQRGFSEGQRRVANTEGVDFLREFLIAFLALQSLLSPEQRLT